ncbi:hypothetical protein P7C70_g1417, partial [Phenoliferia sp. Uapishka_3]
MPSEIPPTAPKHITPSNATKPQLIVLCTEAGASPADFAAHPKGKDGLKALLKRLKERIKLKKAPKKPKAKTNVIGSRPPQRHPSPLPQAPRHLPSASTMEARIAVDGFYSGATSATNSAPTPPSPIDDTTSGSAPAQSSTPSAVIHSADGTDGEASAGVAGKRARPVDSRGDPDDDHDVNKELEDDAEVDEAMAAVDSAMSEDSSQEEMALGLLESGVPISRAITKLMRMEDLLFPDGSEVDAVKLQKQLTAQLTKNGKGKGAARTEFAVVKPYTIWLQSQIGVAGTGIKDDVLDEHTAIAYFNYSSTRALLTSAGKERDDGDTLSANSIKKIFTMLARIAASQVAANPEQALKRPFATPELKKYVKFLKIRSARFKREIFCGDVTAGTLLEYGDWSDRERIRAADANYSLSAEIPSMIRYALFQAWNGQTLHRCDDMLSLNLAFILPFGFHPVGSAGDPLFSLICMQTEGKQQSQSTGSPAYSVLLPHRDSRLDGVGSFGLYLYYVFDIIEIMMNPEKNGGKVWDWEDDATWRHVSLMFSSKDYSRPITTGAVGTAIGKILKLAELDSAWKGHLWRKIMPGILETMGVNEHDISRIGHWVDNVYTSAYASKLPRVGIAACAGHRVGDRVINPRMNVDVPLPLQQLIFPFVEEALSKDLSKGTRKFLTMLFELRKVIILHLAQLYTHYPDSRLFTLPLLHAEKGIMFTWIQEAYPKLLAAEVEKSGQVEQEIKKVSDDGTRNYMGILVDKIARLEALLDRRTAQLSPSRRAPVPVRSCGCPCENCPGDRSSSPSPQARAPSASTRPPVSSSNDFGDDDDDSPPPPRDFDQPPPQKRPTLAAQSEVSTPTVARPSTPPPSTPSSSSRLASPGRLRISPQAPGSAPIDNPFNFKLPNDAAFRNATERAPAHPIVHEFAASWPEFLRRVKQPAYLWYVYRPGSIGSYTSVRDVWEHWADGRMTKAGRVPSIRLLEETFKSGIAKPDPTLVAAGVGRVKGTEKSLGSWRKGYLEDDGNGKKRLSSWRPIPDYIEKRIKQGLSFDDAIKEIDALAAAKKIPPTFLAKISQAVNELSSTARPGQTKVAKAAAKVVGEGARASEPEQSGSGGQQ